MSGPGCVFCAIVAGSAAATVVYEWDVAIAIKPLNPVVRCHTLVIPRVHVQDAAERPGVTGGAAACAAEYGSLMGEPFNLITSVGSAATQTVFHLHWHVVPRQVGDGLTLPWTGQQRGV